MFLQELRTVFNNSQESSASHIGGGKFMIVLPSPVVKSFFAHPIERIGACLEDLRENDALLDMSYVFLVGGFSSSPLVQSIIKVKMHGYIECAVISALRPDVAIVRGAVLFSNNAAAFHSRKARLTYGVVCCEVYDKSIPEHAENYLKHMGPPGEDGKPRIKVFSRHLTLGEDIPVDGVRQACSYSPLLSSQTSVTITIFVSHMKDIMFPNEDECFQLGEVTVPLNMSVPFANRSVLVQFAFGGTELTVTASEETTGEKRKVLLSLVQEVEKCPT